MFDLYLHVFTQMLLQVGAHNLKEIALRKPERLRAKTKEIEKCISSDCIIF